MSTSIPRVHEIENRWVELPDGCRLAARIWLPEGAEEEPVPTILEFIPYRKRDFTAIRDSAVHRFFASHGYASMRVDLRGSGDSDGVLIGEYLQQEQTDALDLLRWIAQQPWSDGSVGMIGLSWGGFNSLQIAMLAPPELKAIIAVCASDDRYADDVHYMGGCLLTDNLSWASTMFAYNSCPPDPAVVGERWREQWLERLEGSGLWIKDWLEHARYDDFWKHASVRENYEGIQCPVFIVSGWADGYTNAVFRVLENLKVPRRGLVGGWGHRYPQEGTLGPAIGFLSECVRWWDRWLKNEDSGIDDDPMLRLWMQDSVAPTVAKRPGRWIAEHRWPSPRVTERWYTVNPHGLQLADRSTPIERELWLQSPLSVGLFAGKWMSYGRPSEIPSDQREEDGGAMVFETDALDKPLELLGAPQLEIVLSVDKPQAMVAARLSDVAPDGRATRVTFGLLNLSHRDSREAPTPVVPGRRYRVVFPMNYMAQRFPAGHRLRLSISTSYWPMAWPSPEPVTMTVVTGQTRLLVHRRDPAGEDKKLRRLSPKDSTSPMRSALIAPARREWQVTHNLATNESALQVVNDDAVRRLESYDWTFGRQVRERYSYVNYRYDTVRGEVIAERHFERGDWSARTVARTVLTSSRTHFRVQATLDAYEGETRFFAKSWDERIPRDNV